MTRGTIVEATIIAAPSSTKNRQKECDPKMHQTKKGNQWDFGMKAHIGVDSQTTLLHSVAATAAHVHDSQVLPEWLPGKETRVWGDAASSGQRDVIRQHAPHAQSFVQMKALRHRSLSETERARNRTKSKVEHAFLVIKRIFGWPKSDTAGWRRTLTGSISAVGWPICIWRDVDSWRDIGTVYLGSGHRAIERRGHPTKRLPDQRRPTELAREAAQE